MGKGERGARREGGQRLQLSGQQVLRGRVTADSGCFPPWGPAGRGLPSHPPGPWSVEDGESPSPVLRTVGISSL